MARVRVKICGITRPEDALAAAAAGADAIGLVFYPPSPRAVTVEQAAEIIAVLPAFVSTVGLFVDPEADALREVLSKIHLSALQFHGAQDAAFAEQFGLPYVQAVAVTPELDLNVQALRYASAQALLLDKFDPVKIGGTGERFAWDTVGDLCAIRQAFILAGGLNVDNVAAGIAALEPYAVDVSSGVESAPGIKDSGLIEQFIAQARLGGA